MSPELLRKFFRYEPETGELVWRITRKGRGCVAGRTAGTINHRRDTSYRAVMLNGKKLYVHRVVWEMHHGPIQAGMCIDHIDGNGINNRLDNLRLVTLSENQRNRRLDRATRLGIHGVHPFKGGFSVQCANRYVGYYKDFFEACCARKAAENNNNFHPNHGRK